MHSLPDEIRYALEKLQSRGYKTYVIGGAVRDMLRGVTPFDYDFATSASPSEIETVFSDFQIDLKGAKYGSVTVIVNGFSIEITALRKDGKYVDKRHAESVVMGVGLEEDVRRRDFTINALAFDGEKVIDLVNGKADLAAHTVRCIGDPYKSFSEDALRILRAIRFVATLGFEIETETENALFANKSLLLEISKTRVTDELFKILCGDFADVAIERYIDVFGVIMPELSAMKGFDQKSIYHNYDLLTHTAKTVALCPQDSILRLAALIHDVGKPFCFTTDEDGHRHFKGHPKVSLKYAEKFCQCLALTTRQKKTLKFLVEFHDEPLDLSDAGVENLLDSYGAENMQKLCALKIADASTHSAAAEGRVIAAKTLEKQLEKILNGDFCYSLSGLAVDGHDVMSLGIESGRQVGEILQKLLSLVRNGDLPNDKEKLMEYAKTRLE